MIVKEIKTERGRARIRVEEHVCAYCGQDVDPRDPGAHVAVCTRHPAYKYKQALERLLLRIDEIERLAAVAGSRHIDDAHIEDLLHEATTSARREAFGPARPARNGEDYHG